MGTYDLTDKVVMITGGTGGVGSATARALLAKVTRVAILDLHEKTADFAVALSPDRAIGPTADVCDRNALDSAVAEVTERFDRVDVAIANAGILGLPRTVRATLPPIADKVLQVNISGALNTGGGVDRGGDRQPGPGRPDQLRLRVHEPRRRQS